MEPVIEPVFSLLQEPEKSDIEECAGNCILSENEIERALSEHLKQDVLPQLPEAHSPDWGAASPQREQEAACNKPPHRKRASKKLALVANVQKLHTEEKPYKCTECDANHSEATFLHHKEEQRCGTEKHTMDHLSLVLEECKYHLSDCLLGDSSRVEGQLLRDTPEVHKAASSHVRAALSYPCPMLVLLWEEVGCLWGERWQEG
ncbi:zinc finger protein 319 isoform X4 [Columba livia]|uniref:zinc finger protein 319 isoform X4 n=1 Tax=Columba livia TaxID=8932 RepID=UPI0031B9DC34